MQIEVVYALKHEQILFAFNVEQGCTVAEAIQYSGILTKYPELDLAQLTVGIFSQLVSLDSLVKTGDRIEIYRPLTIDPKTARRLRAKKNLTRKKTKSS